MATVFLAALLLLLLFAFQPPLAEAANPCEISVGSDRLDLNFTETYGVGDHLPPVSEERALSQLVGFATVNATAASGYNDTIELRLFDAGGNRFANGTAFNAAELYFDLTVRSGLAYLGLKQGIDREILDIYSGVIPGTTAAVASIKLGIECIPVNGTFSAKNYTATVVINDVNDNRPAFYNSSANSSQSNFYGFVRENTPQDMLVFDGAEARDVDSSLNAMTRVSVLDNPFLIAVGNGSAVRLYTKRRINYDPMLLSVQTVSAVVLAVDSPGNTSTALTFTTIVVLTIISDGDPPPKFVVPGCAEFLSVCVSPAYTASVVSGVNTTNGSLVVRPGPILAENQVPLSLMNWSISYSFFSGDNMTGFSIGANTGIVTQLLAIDRQVSLVVKATKYMTEGNWTIYSRYSLATLTIFVEQQSTTSRPLTTALDSGTAAAMTTSGISASSTAGVTSGGVITTVAPEAPTGVTIGVTTGVTIGLTERITTGVTTRVTSSATTTQSSTMTTSDRTSTLVLSRGTESTQQSTLSPNATSISSGCGGFTSTAAMVGSDGGSGSSILASFGQNANLAWWLLIAVCVVLLLGVAALSSALVHYRRVAAELVAPNYRPRPPNQPDWSAARQDLTMTDLQLSHAPVMVTASSETAPLGDSTFASGGGEKGRPAWANNRGLWQGDDENPGDQVGAGGSHPTRDYTRSEYMDNE